VCCCPGSCASTIATSAGARESFFFTQFQVRDFEYSNEAQNQSLLNSMPSSPRAAHAPAPTDQMRLAFRCDDCWPGTSYADTGWRQQVKSWPPQVPRLDEDTTACAGADLDVVGSCPSPWSRRPLRTAVLAASDADADSIRDGASWPTRCRRRHGGPGNASVAAAHAPPIRVVREWEFRNEMTMLPDKVT
jgi:hypothetical protein